ncbi:hypothetical protein ERO13_D09G185475v2 [Gossypium hirsutum]|uniref:Uncharacterized protein n=1 Tax=Gossypium tomentosum TaxID=34277 RepID=A0A5D2JL35_GOSTO|nr:hypothetical protein ERO13_D09G185475v2 [Gossypium hirsutum]TYH55195.1 hypothetical protein ES332_D09G220900v1 [Gossypium tomentosum]
MAVPEGSFATAFVALVFTMIALPAAVEAQPFPAATLTSDGLLFLALSLTISLSFFLHV